MAREPELSIKVKVDPQIKPTELKTSIERKVKQSGEKPQIDIDPNVDGIKKKVEDKLKNIKATASITPVVDTEKLKTDIQQQINGIGDIPKITVGVNVDDFSDELSKRLKEELKSVNDKLSYYLKNLTTNTAGLNSVVEGLFPSRGISNAVQSELKSIQVELTAGLKGVKSKVKPFKETDLFQIGDTESTTTIRRVEKLVKNIREQFASLDNFYDADEEKFLDGFNSEFEKFQNNASETVEKLSALKKNLSKDKFSDLLDNEDFDAESTTKALTPLISFLKKLSTTSIKTGEDYDNLYALFNNKNTNKLFDESNDHLTRMKTRVGDITAETKTAIEVTGELAKTLNKAIKDDNSGYLSDAEIKTYGAAFDEVLSNIATKQEEINTKKQRTVELENDLLTKTRSNREALKQELEEYKKLLKSFGVKGDEDEGNPKGKPKPKSKEPDKTPTQKPAEEPKAENQDALNNGIAKIQAIVFDINQEELQKSIDTIFAKVSAPIGFKPANGAIANIKQQLQEAFSDIEINATNVNLQNPKTENVAPKYHILNKDELHKLSMELSTASCLSFTDYKRAIQTFEDADYGKRFGFPELEPHDISIELAKELGNAMKRYDYDYGDSDAIDILKRFGAKTNDSGEVIDFENFVKNAAYKFFGPQNRNKITSQNAARLQELLQSQDEEIQAYASFIEKLNSKLVETKQFGPRAYFDDTDEQFSYSLSSAERDALSNFEHKSYSDEFSRNLHATLVEPVGTPDSFGYYFDDINTMVAEIYNLAQQRLIQSVGDLSGQTEAVKDQTSIHGKVTITDADVIVDVKNPVTIPGTVTVDPNSVQLGNSDDLQKNANALSSVKQSLNKISTSAEEYSTKIAAIGPSVQYVAQEVDNLSKSLENQITDLDLIAKKTDAYGTTANSVTLNTKDVAAPTAPVDIPGKVTLKVEDVTPPKDSVKIPGKVELEVSDITPPKTAVELEGKVSNVTVDDSAKGKKKNVKDDVKKPEVIDLKGKVELKDEDIKRPNPLNLNGAVKVKTADVKIDDVEISKKKFDIKGNLILKNAEIVDAVKEAVGKESKKKDDSESTQKTTTAKKKPTSRRGLISELTTVNKKIAETRNKLEDVSEDESGTIQKHLEDLKANRTEIIELLNETNTDSDKWYSDRKFRYANKEVAYTRLRHTDSKSAKENQENIQAAQNERDKYNNEKLSAYRAYRSEQNTYKLKKARLGEDENSDEAIAIDNAISKLDTKKKAALNSMKLTIQEHANLLDQMGKEDNEVEEKVNRQISIIKGHESNKNKVAQTTRGKKITDQLSAAQKTYGTEEEANATGKVPTSIQKALSVQQQLVDKIAKAKVGTEEYNNAIQAAEENWKSVAAIIDTAEKKQKDLAKAVDSIEKKFYQLAEEASGSSNEKLKNSINGVITKAATLSAQNPNTYENYAVDYNELKRESYKANAQYTIWKSNYKKLEREGIKIAEGVEVARQMQADGSLQNVKFDGIDNLLKQLNELEPQTDAYKEKLVEVKKIWEEIERKVKAVEEAEKQAAKRESTKAANLISIGNAISQNRATMKDVQKNYGTDYSFYGKLQEKDSKLKTLLDTVNESSDPVSGAKEWAKNNLDISPDKINSVTDAIKQLNIAYREATQEAKDFNKEASREKSINKASMEVANLKATIHDYIAEHKKLEGTDVGKSLYELLEALNQSDAPEKIGELKKKYAELRAESKKLGLESRNLLDVFEKLFGQHLSTMITMAALHKMQDALRIVYQNVVEIDTAVTELRKVSEYTGKSLEEYMGRAAEQAQKLGVSISDYVNSTADWKRLGYSDEDAENLATYSTLLKNVGDNIDDVNTSSSYLISTLQGFGLLADQAEDVVNKIDAVANTQPVTAKDLGEILTRSSAAMSAANNTLEETIALGTAANSVIQDADTVGTTLKSLSMYLRAAKSDAENAGIEVDGMANSVSELRSELKSLTGVDIMLDSKNFKSTYQIMKELSQVWSGLSDVTQANVTEMIGGKRNANAVSAILNNFDVAESTMESAANSANVAWEENEKYLDSIQGRLAQLDAAFQVLSQDVLSSDLVKGGVSFLTSIVKLLDKIVNLTGALPLGLGIGAFATQLGEPKMTGFMIVPSNTPGGDTEQVLRKYFSLRSMREYLVKPTNMVA
nr:MAG TPA: minor tail protein [Caudoviricetes sp.]